MSRAKDNQAGFRTSSNKLSDVNKVGISEATPRMSSIALTRSRNSERFSAAYGRQRPRRPETVRH